MVGVKCRVKFGVWVTNSLVIAKFTLTPSLTSTLTRKPTLIQPYRPDVGTYYLEIKFNFNNHLNYLSSLAILQTEKMSLKRLIKFFGKTMVRQW